MVCWLTLYNNSFGLFSVKTMIKSLVLGLFLLILATPQFQFRHSSWDQSKFQIQTISSSWKLNKNFQLRAIIHSEWMWATKLTFNFCFNKSASYCAIKTVQLSKSLEYPFYIVFTGHILVEMLKLNIRHWDAKEISIFKTNFRLIKNLYKFLNRFKLPVTSMMRKRLFRIAQALSLYTRTFCTKFQL